MNRNTKIPLGKKDMVLRDWWNEASKEQDVISKPICLAVEYYNKTGKFINLGTIKATNEPIENTILKYVYIPENSPAYKYLENKQENGERVATVVKYILRNSIKTGNKTELTGCDELRSLVEQLNYNTAPEIKTYAAPPVVTTERIEQPRMEEKIYKKEPEPPITSNSSSQSEEYQEDDLIANLIGNVMLDIG